MEAVNSNAQVLALHRLQASDALCDPDYTTNDHDHAASTDLTHGAWSRSYGGQVKEDISDSPLVVVNLCDSDDEKARPKVRQEPSTYANHDMIHNLVVSSTSSPPGAPMKTRAKPVAPPIDRDKYTTAILATERYYPEASGAHRGQDIVGASSDGARTEEKMHLEGELLHLKARSGKA
ncbi:hypothetical protein LTR86_001787 [Recurvomyces mirabilis]|nr:hypothetical protein LTR86_001787 [Recurvomyces mirabilis]